MRHLYTPRVFKILFIFLLAGISVVGASNNSYAQQASVDDCHASFTHTPRPVYSAGPPAGTSYYEDVTATISGCSSKFRNLRVDTESDVSRSGFDVRQDGVWRPFDATPPNASGAHGPDWGNGMWLQISSCESGAVAIGYGPRPLIGAANATNGNSYPYSLTNNCSSDGDHFKTFMVPAGNYYINTTSFFSGQYVCSVTSTQQHNSYCDASCLTGVQGTPGPDTPSQPGCGYNYNTCASGRYGPPGQAYYTQRTEEVAYFGDSIQYPNIGPVNWNIIPRVSTNYCFSNPGTNWFYESHCIPHPDDTSRATITCQAGDQHYVTVEIHTPPTTIIPPPSDGLPNLTADAPTSTGTLISGVYHQTAYTGSTVTVNIRNIGTYDALTTFPNKIQYSYNDTNNPVDWITDRPLTNLSVGQTKPISITWFAGPGLYYFRACADLNNGVVDEGPNENDNCGAWTAVQWDLPDLTASAPTVNGTLIAGSPNYTATVTANISNIGAGDVNGTFPNKFQYSPNNGQNIYDYGADVSLTDLAAGASKQISYSWVSGPGNLVFRACANQNNSSVSESNPNNNCSGWTAISFPIPAPTVDLKVGGLDSITLTNSNGSGVGTYLTWSSQNTTGTCSITAPGFSLTGLPLSYSSANDGSGTAYYTGNLTQTKTFTLSCPGFSGSSPTNGTDNATVTIQSPQPPATPTITPVAAPCTSPGTINILFSAASGATNYTLSRNPYSYSGSGWGDINNYTAANLPSQATDSGLIYGQSYFYQLRASNYGGTTYASIPGAVVASSPCPPDLSASTPWVSGQVVSGTNSYIANTSATLYANVSNGGAGSVNGTFQNKFQYSTDNVYFSDISTNQPITNLASGSSQTISTTWAPGAGGYYIRACADSTNVIAEADSNDDDCGPSYYATWANVPAPTVNLLVAGQKSTTITRNTGTYLTWSSTNISGNCLLLLPSGSITVSPSSSGQYSVGPLTQNTTYSITCWGATGSNPSSVTDSVSVYIAAPSQVVVGATTGPCGVPGSVNLSYSGGANGTTYYLYRKANADTSPYDYVKTYSPLPSPSLDQDTALTPGVPYYYQIQATNEGGSSSYSNRPVGATASIGCPPTVTLQWNGGPGPVTISDTATGVLSWSTTNVTGNCTATNAWAGSKAFPNGSESQGPLPAGLNHFVLTCPGANGQSASASLDVTVNVSQISVSLTSTANPVDYNTGTTLSWTTTGNPTSCVAIQGPWPGSKTASGGSQSTGNLIADTTYVIKCSKNGTSDVTSQTTVRVKPAAFTLTPLTAACGGKINLFAAQSGAAVGYELNRNPYSPTNFSTGWGVIGNYPPTASPDPYTALQSALNQAGLVPNNTYHYQVRAYNSSNDSTYSNSSTGPATDAAASDFCPANPPSNPTASSQPYCLPSGNTGSVSLSWSPPSSNVPATQSYSIYDSATLLQSVTTTSYLDSRPLVPGSTHVYRVSAWSTDGIESTRMPTPNGLSVAVPSSCPAAPSVTIYAGGTRGATSTYNNGTYLTWTNNNNNIPAGNPCTLSASPATSNWPQSVPGSHSGTSYYTGNLTQTTTFTLSCPGLAGSAQDGTSGTASTQSSVTVNVLPEQPTVTVNAFSCNNTTNGRVSLSYTGGGNTTSYNLYRNAGSDSSPYSTFIGNYPSLASLPSIDAGLTSGTDYYYQVEAVNIAGSSSSIRPKHAIANGTCPLNTDLKINECPSPSPSPTPVYGPISADYNGCVTLTWSGNNDRSCTVSSSPGTSWTGTRTIGQTQTEQVSGLSANTPYTFNLSCTNTANVTQVQTVTANLRPSVPSLTGSTGSCGGNITLNLGASNFATNYELSRNPYNGAGPGYGVIQTYSSGSLPATITDSNLSLGTSYSYQLRAYNNAGSAYSQILTLNSSGGCAATVDVKAKDTNSASQPSDGPITIINGGTVTLTWTSQNVTGACTATPTGGDWSGQKASSDTTGTIVNGLTTGNYTLGITCPGATGNVSDSVQVTVNPITPISVILSANGQTVNTVISPNTAATLAWTTSGNPTSCTASGSSQGWTSSKSVSGGTQSTGNLSSNQTYTITCSKSGVPDTSSTVNVQLRPEPVDISVNTSSTCGGKIALSATPAPHATSYELYRNTSDSSPYDTDLGNFTANNIPTTDPVPSPGQTYFYQIQAINSAGSTYSPRPRSAVSSAACVIPNPTVDLKVGRVGDDVSLATDGPMQSAYNVPVVLYWTTTNTPNPNACTTSWSATQTNNSSGEQTSSLTASQYTFSITCSGQSGSTAATDSVVVNVDPPAPTQPAISATTGNCSVPGSIGLTLTQSSGATGYKLHRSDNGAPYNQLPVGNPTIYSANNFPTVDTGLTQGHTYSYQVEAVNQGPSSSSSQITSATPSNPCVVAPTVNFLINGQHGTSAPVPIDYYNQTATFSWVFGNGPTSCSASSAPKNRAWSTADGVQIYPTPTSASQPVGGINQDSTYSLTCSNSAGTGSDSVPVHIINVPQPDYTVTPSDSFVLNFISNTASSNQVTFAVSPLNGFNKDVTFALITTSIGSGSMSATIVPNPATGAALSSNGGTNVNVNVVVKGVYGNKNAIAPGITNLTFSGTLPDGTTRTFTVPVQIIVTNPSFKEF